ncbi:MAG: hypothetical protein ACJ71U_21680 [Terriglobales bacterium]
MAEVLSAPNNTAPCRLWDYGYYNGIRFFMGWPNKAMIEEFLEVYTAAIGQKEYDIDLSDPGKRPSVVAHSFGTYILGYSMLKYKEIKFDKIILCGSILPTDFDWFTLFARDQVSRVKNEFGLRDIWAGMVGRFVAGTGNSGRRGFEIVSSALQQHRLEFFKHSDFFHRSHIETSWVPFLMSAPSYLAIKHGRDVEDVKEFNTITDMTGPVIDTACFGNLPHYSEIEIPRGLSLEWIKVNPDIYTFLMDRRNNQARGYINAMPVNDELFAKLKSGAIEDNEVTADGLEPFTEGAILRMYLMSIAIAPELHRVGPGLLQPAFEQLLNGFIDKLVYYAQTNSVRVSELVAVGWTLQGKKLCRIFGMDEVGKDRFNNPVFWIDLNDPTVLQKRRFYPAVRKLIAVYQQMRDTRSQD